MHLLLDTHTLLWWLDGDKRLPRKIRTLIANETDHTIYVSAATAWEISTKVRIGKLPGAVEVAHTLTECLASQNFQSLPITIAHAQRAGLLPGPHRDPFDRMLIAQALHENFSIVSNDLVLDRYGVSRVW